MSDQTYRAMRKHPKIMIEAPAGVLDQIRRHGQYVAKSIARIARLTKIPSQVRV